MSSSSATPKTRDWWLVVDGGPDAGLTAKIPAEGMTVGRGPGQGQMLVVDDPTVSGVQLRIGAAWFDDGHVVVPLIEPLTAHNVTLLDGEPLSSPVTPPPDRPLRLRLGATAVSILQAPPPDQQAALGATLADGRQAFHRQPRPARSDGPSPIYVPPARPDARPPSRLSMSAILAPLALGAVLAVAMNPRFALLALTSPLMVLANWLEDRRRAKRERASGQRSTKDELTRFVAALQESHRYVSASITGAHPGVGQLALRAELPTVSLWERRLDHRDCGQLVIGYGSRALAHQLVDPRADWLAGCRDLLSEHTTGHDLPIVVSLAAGSVLGLHGHQDSCLAVTRSLLSQAALLHGPADLAIAILTDDQHQHRWRWAADLPHTGSRGVPHLALSDGGAEELITTLTDERPDDWTIIVVDSEGALERPHVRALLNSPPPGAAVMVIGERIDRLPSQATTVIGVESLMGTISISTPILTPESRARLAAQRTDIVPACVTNSTMANEPVVLSGCSIASASRIATRLGQFNDADERRADASLPETIRLGTILNLDDQSEYQNTAEHETLDHQRAILQRWSTSNRAAPVAPIAMSETGTFTINLTTDGPHGLIAGTTGSGKSELLRSLIASLAFHHPPTHVNFVLIDYKGGAAFSTLARLPHVVGMVTDLDAGLGQRALRCLEAELRYREHLLNDNGADDLNSYSGTEPLPRLVVVIDEFATMAADLPDFIASLVSIAQRGRSLGVHLILATQRPAGAVNDSIRANMNLRISLRVQSSADSTDVLGVTDAAQLSRRFPGRALVRTGPNELIAVQTASSTLAPMKYCATASSRPRFIEEANDNRSAGGAVETTSHADASDHTEPSDLEHIVELCCHAATVRGDQPPRRPWPEPLPTSLTLADLQHIDSNQTTSALYDLPDTQCQTATQIELSSDNVSFIGATRSRIDLAAAVTVGALCLNHEPERLHVYLVDFGAQSLSAFAKLPHVGAFITPSESSRLHRLARYLTNVLEHRRTAAQNAATSTLEANVRILVVIENWSALKATHDDLLGSNLLDVFARLFADGPSFGITTLITSDRPNALSSAISSSFAHRFAFQLLDPLDDSMLGIRRDAAPRNTPGRAIDMSTYCDVQFAVDQPLGELAQQIVDRWFSTPLTSATRPATIDVLPAAVAFQAVPQVASVSHDEQANCDVLRLDFALGDSDLASVGWSLSEGEHGVVAGPPSTGKTTTLATIAAAARAQFPDVELHALCGRRRQLIDLTDAQSHRSVRELLECIDGTSSDPTHPTPQLILIDDAEFIDDDGGRLLALIQERRPGLWICASARPDALRSSYGTFTAALRKSRQGFILRPQREVDGELWMTTLPRKNVDSSFPPGRGFLIRDGFAELAQVMVTLDQRWLQVPMSTTIES